MKKNRDIVELKKAIQDADLDEILVNVTGGCGQTGCSSCMAGCSTGCSMGSSCGGDIKGVGVTPVGV